MPEIGTSFFELKAALGKLYDEHEAAAIAHECLYHITGLDRLTRLTQKHQVLSPEQAAQFSKMKTGLLQGMPLQYLIGSAHFLGRDFTVSPAVLIPRPETEELVQWILEGTPPQQILDIGTGSGCIAISLALAWPACTLHAIDISTEALNIAKDNALQLGARLHFQQGDFLKTEQCEQLGQFDILVSNPPYIPVAERMSLHPNVREYEPGTALFVPSDDALLFYRAIADFGKGHLTAKGWIYCELHRDFAAEAAALFRQEGYEEVHVRKDMQGNERMLRAQLRERM
ncbi:MAG: peptide chain release factor N(5)-glutamine methyltransferase [Bacteroidetes bacterium]|nr:peptide chain release factor N(5)-glutamine methyltransferase [Bacteroidota bacterium]